MLSSDARAFFREVAAAAFANPFSEERARRDRRLAATLQTPRDPAQEATSSSSADSANPELDAALSAVRAELDRLWPLDLNTLEGEDRHLVEVALLFDTFHVFVPEFDALVTRQLEAGSRPVKATFGLDVVRRLVERGMSPERAARFVGIFYQMRRAFFMARERLKGQSPSMQRLRARLWQAIFTDDLARYEARLWDRMEDFSIFLIGPTGSGKGAAASVLGASSWIPFDDQAGRFALSFSDLFVPLNLSQFPETLIESELFGHKKGAFTGAIEAHEGVFGRCPRHGVIFLDEIGETSLPTQIKLLRVLQERVFVPVGGHEEQRFEGRVVAATNRDIGQAREEGRFRDDFYYRLCSDVIEVPSLAERLREEPAELKELVAHSVERILGQPDEGLFREVVASLGASLPEGYAWPGNVRELEQAVRRTLLGAPYRGDLRQDRPQSLDTPELSLVAAELGARIDAGALTMRELQQAYCRLLYARSGTYEEVARQADIDRRTARRYIEDEL
ncbi:sigma-54-dependent Fis family transcriptional regulator [Lujinxingia vulgaris]|uniref:Sigma-54-dependent Fis family transcriptional regulator n=1 Tax=Lujinxingia vulgaris TaxID=2600176 RepID=A0A5C6X478_9DELT|nr:sigma 54-interacting transcriptional regulator [Lujinxingia vulgaris]TXD33083.1 sigma-54-dependent Fis family transcriptional regulator [Lujinxingia vulgaris]